MFDALYAHSDDPWKIEHRWYEQRKRALILAALPHAQYDVIVEPGCGTGALTALLAQRCTRLIACDISAAAVALAQDRLKAHAHVQLSCQQIPQQWPCLPAEQADCIVISEVAYYLAPAQLAHLVHRIATTLTATGVLLACHWKRDFPERTLRSGVLHDYLQRALALTTLGHYEDSDFVLDVWSPDGRSVAIREGST